MKNCKILKVITNILNMFYYYKLKRDEIKNIRNRRK